MIDVLSLARTNVRSLSPCTHGGNVWGVSKKFQIPLNKIIDFSVSTNPLGPPPKVLQAIKSSLWLIRNYPDPDPQVLKGLLADYIGNSKPENIVLGNGSAELIHLFAEAFLDTECEAIIPVPTFGEYEVATIKAGGKPRFVKLKLFDDFPLSAKQVGKFVSSRTRMIFLCNPNSPTGVLFPKSEILEIIRFAEEKNILVFLDENYVDFVDADKRYSMVGYVTRFNNLFVLRSLTKFFSLVGLRMGFGVASSDIVNFMDRIRTPWSVNSLAMVAAAAAVKDKAFLERSRLLISEEKAYLLKELREIGWLEVHPSDANFFLIKILKSGLTSTQIKDKLAKDGLLIRDCRSFRGLNDRFFRVSIRKRVENRQLIKSLRLLTKEGR